MRVVNPARSIYPNLMSNTVLQHFCALYNFIKACLVCFRLKSVVGFLNAEWIRLRNVEPRHEIQPGRYLCQNRMIRIVQPPAGLGALDVDLVKSRGMAAAVFCRGPAELLK